MTGFRFPVEAGHIGLFARSVGDHSPTYLDPDDAVAPPTFVQAGAHFDPDWPFRPRPGEPWLGSGREPTGSPEATDSDDLLLHAEQHFEYHRPLRPGTALSVTSRPGERWEKHGRRGGRLLFEATVTEYRDEVGELVITSRSVSVRPEAPVDGGVDR